MGNVILTVCDSNRMYCERLQEYLRNHLKLSFEIHAFTDTEKLLQFSQMGEISLLVISESAIRRLKWENSYKQFKNVIILDEETKEWSGQEKALFPEGNLRHISKYSPATKIAEEVLELCTSHTDGFSGLSGAGITGRSNVIGFFTPLSRSGQTSLLVKMGECLAKKHKTIMLSFESFSALPSLFEAEAEEDITDLLYFADCERDKFCLYLERIRKNRNGLDYISPARTAMQVKEISFEKVRELIKLLCQEAGYEYVLLDMKEYPDGFFEILGLCDVIYTITRNNSADHYRLSKYNKVLGDNGYEDIVAKTIKFIIPDVREGASYNRYVEALLAEGQEVMSLGA